MKTIRTITVLFLGFFVCAFSICCNKSRSTSSNISESISANVSGNKKAIKLMESELSKYLVKYGKYYFAKRGTANAFDKGLISNLSYKLLYADKKDISMDLEDVPLTKADELNGFESAFLGHFRYNGPTRTYFINKWADEWKDDNLRIDFEIVCRKGEWSIQRALHFTATRLDIETLDPLTLPEIPIPHDGK